MDGTDIQGFSGRRLWGPSVGNEQEFEKHSQTLWDINEMFKDKDSLESDEKIEKVKDESKMSPKLKDKKSVTKIEGKEGKSSPPIVQSLKTSTANTASIITNTIKPIGK